MKTITCSDCGRERKTRNKTTKYCLLCRYARNLKWLKETTVECALGDHRFAPLKRGDEVCGKCDMITSDFEPIADCSFCDRKEVPIVCEDIRVCKHCATDPDQRKKFRNAVLLKQKLVIEGRA